MDTAKKDSKAEGLVDDPEIEPGKEKQSDNGKGTTNEPTAPRDRDRDPDTNQEHDEGGDDDESSKPEPASASRPSLRRERKATQAYTVTEFRERSAEATVEILPPGRGTPLGDLVATRLAMEAASPTEQDMVHQFLFNRKYRAKPQKKDVLPNILQVSQVMLCVLCCFWPFALWVRTISTRSVTHRVSSHLFIASLAAFFLPKRAWMKRHWMPWKKNSRYDTDTTERRHGLCRELGSLTYECTHHLQARYSTKAYKLRVGDVKRLCDLLAVDRNGRNDKTALVNALLDFVAVPGKEALVQANKRTAGGRKRSSSSPLKKRPRRDSNEKDETQAAAASDSDESAYEEPSKGEMPSDSELRKWVQAFVRCYNMENVSLKVAIEIASDKFGVDIAPLKETLKILLTEEL